MSEALAKIYALQQREINEIENANRQRAAKRAREVTAFMNSGLPELFGECAALPIKKDAQQRMYKKVFAECTYQHCDTRTRQVWEMTFTQPGGGSGSGPRWWCQESPDSGKMQYLYSKTGSYSFCEVHAATPNGEWMEAFIRYIAAVCDPQAVADKLSESHERQNRETHSSRRQIQKV